MWRLALLLFSTFLFVYLSVCLFIYLYLSISVSVYLPINNFEFVLSIRLVLHFHNRYNHCYRDYLYESSIIQLLQ